MATNLDKAQTVGESLEFGIGGPGITKHNATPEGAVTAPVGSLVLRSDTGDLYRKTSGSGNTGWTIVSSGSGSPYFDDDGGTPSVAPSAAGTDSIAIGEGASVASGATNSFAIGTSSSVAASVTNAIALGKSSSAAGTSAIAIGEESDATVPNSIAIGRFSQSTAYHAIAIGSSATLANAPTASSSYTIAIGFNSLSSNVDGVSIGRSAETFSQKSIAIGLSAKVLYSSSQRSIAIGNNSKAGHASQFTINGIVIGYSSKGYKSTAGIYSPIAIGTEANSSASHAIGIGSSTISSAANSISIGNSAQSSSISAIAFGNNTNTSGLYSISLGNSANARVEKTIQIQSTSIVRKDDGILDSGTDLFMWGAANESVVFTAEINLKTAATKTITVPTNSRFYPTEVGLILTTLGGTITTQPDVSFGITGTNNKFVTQTTSSLAALYERDVYTALTTTGESTLTFTVNVIAAGSADIKGRAYFKGILVEIQ